MALERPAGPESARTEARFVRRHERRVVTAIKLGLIVFPLVLGWCVGTVLDLRAIRHLRRSRPPDRIAAFLLGPLAGVRYTLEGYRYRGWSIAVRLIGLALTGLFVGLFGSRG